MATRRARKICDIAQRPRCHFIQRCDSHADRVTSRLHSLAEEMRHQLVDHSIRRVMKYHGIQQPVALLQLSRAECTILS